MSLTDEESFLLSGLPTSEENTRQDERTALLASIEEKVKGLITYAEYGGYDCGGVMMYLEGEKTDLGPDGDVNTDMLYLALPDVLEILEGMK